MAISTGSFVQHACMSRSIEVTASNDRCCVRKIVRNGCKPIGVDTLLSASWEEPPHRDHSNRSGIRVEVIREVERVVPPKQLQKPQKSGSFEESLHPDWSVRCRRLRVALLEVSAQLTESQNLRICNSSQGVDEIIVHRETGWNAKRSLHLRSRS